MRGVDVNGEEPKERYRPERIGTAWINRHVVWSAFLFGVASIIFLVACDYLMTQYGLLDRSGAAKRQTLGHAIHCIVGMFFMLGAPHVIDFFYHGNLVKGMLNDPRSCGNYLCSVVLGTAYIYTNWV